MANKIKYNSGIDTNALNMGNWKVGSEQGMGPTTSTGYKNGMQIPEGGYSIYSDNITARTASNDSELITIINKLSKEKAGWFTLYALTYPENTQTPASRDGITPGFDNITGSKLYTASRDLNYYVFDEDNNSWVPDSYFNGERNYGHCYDTYDGQPNQHATFQADYDNIKATFPNATHIVIGSHAAENNDNNSSTLARLQELGLPADHIGTSRPEYILVGKPNRPELTMYVRENVSSNVAHLNVQLPLEDVASNAYEALTWAKNNNVLVLNRSIENKVKNGLKLYLDAGMVASYPKGGTKLYDLSGNNNHHNIVNNPIHNDKDFTLNETQGFNISNAATKSTDSTVVIWYKTTDGQELWVRGDSGSEYIAASHSGGNYYHQSSGSPTYYADLSQVTNPNTQGVRDGRYHMVEAKNVNFSAWDSMNWFLYGSSWNMNGSVAKIMVYDRPLTVAESIQNYYGGPITTRNLQQHYDFSNLVCYETGETEIRNLVNPSQSSAITNTASAISYNNQMGYLEWTGDSNAYIDIPDTPKMPKFSLSTWVWNDPTGANSRHSILRNYWEIVDTSIQFWSYDFDNDYWRSSGNGAVPYNEWTHITTTWDGSVIRHYINGVLYWTDPNTSGGTSQNMYNFGGYNGRILDGKYATLSIYDDTLTDQEILNNYNAHAARFK